ncbi:M48 family metallopeptidase [Terrimonas pollutisoli]|uniref:M48 family metallopeptidase n=1 Tax=Terrimonas pollutisoli TaxID=3034147 RepID=UPI0023ECB6BA|nr:M48 family metallopeptidase [Terrimonas sp. H1YJ31]
MLKRISYFLLISTVVIACSKNTITGRSQLKLLPESQLQAMATEQYQQFLNTNKVVSASSNRDAEMVTRVGQRISRAVEQFYASKGLSGELEGYKWEYKLVESKDVNAWCMPGGKIVVYTGLLPITQNEAALAAVMGHEVSHAIFNHGNERMSQAMGAEAVGMGLQVALANKPAATQNLFLQAFGLGSQVGVLLPFSRKHELEADRYGLIWAAMAGYNPREAIALWERMEKASNGQKPPEFLSSHPSEGTRREQLERYMPEALKYYKPVNR